jgi:hypothetical protein
LSLKFYFLNVGHGSSVVIELDEGGSRQFGVVDSNATASAIPKALLKLQERGAEQLSFVLLTHPHRDHFSGLFDILTSYGTKIGLFYTFPMGDLISNRSRLKKLASHLRKVSQLTDGDAERNAAFELLQIIRWADGRASDWIECAGEKFTLGPPGFQSVDIATVMPPKASKGDYIARIDREDPAMFGNMSDNDVSLAVCLSYQGKTVLLGGDAPRDNWLARRRFERNTKDGRLEASIVNLPLIGPR